MVAVVGGGGGGEGAGNWMWAFCISRAKTAHPCRDQAAVLSSVLLLALREYYR